MMSQLRSEREQPKGEGNKSTMTANIAGESGPIGRMTSTECTDNEWVANQRNLPEYERIFGPVPAKTKLLELIAKTRSPLKPDQLMYKQPRWETKSSGPDHERVHAVRLVIDRVDRYDWERYTPFSVRTLPMTTVREAESLAASMACLIIQRRVIEEQVRISRWEEQRASINRAEAVHFEQYASSVEKQIRAQDEAAAIIHARARPPPVVNGDDAPGWGLPGVDTGIFRFRYTQEIERLTLQLQAQQKQTAEILDRLSFVEALASSLLRYVKVSASAGQDAIGNLGSGASKGDGVYAGNQGAVGVTLVLGSQTVTVTLDDNMAPGDLFEFMFNCVLADVTSVVVYLIDSTNGSFMPLATLLQGAAGSVVLGTPRAIVGRIRLTTAFTTAAVLAATVVATTPSNFLLGCQSYPQSPYGVVVGEQPSFPTTDGSGPGGVESPAPKPVNITEVGGITVPVFEGVANVPITGSVSISSTASSLDVNIKSTGGVAVPTSGEDAGDIPVATGTVPVSLDAIGPDVPSGPLVPVNFPTPVPVVPGGTVPFPTAVLNNTFQAPGTGPVSVSIDAASVPIPTQVGNGPLWVSNIAQVQTQLPTNDMELTAMLRRPTHPNAPDNKSQHAANGNVDVKAIENLPVNEALKLVDEDADTSVKDFMVQFMWVRNRLRAPLSPSATDSARVCVQLTQRLFRCDTVHKQDLKPPAPDTKRAPAAPAAIQALPKVESPEERRQRFAAIKEKKAQRKRDHEEDVQSLLANIGTRGEVSSLIDMSKEHARMSDYAKLATQVGVYSPIYRATIAIAQNAPLSSLWEETGLQAPWMDHPSEEVQQWDIGMWDMMELMAGKAFQRAIPEWLAAEWSSLMHALIGNIDGYSEYLQATANKRAHSITGNTEQVAAAAAIGESVKPQMDALSSATRAVAPPVAALKPAGMKEKSIGIKGPAAVVALLKEVMSCYKGEKSLIAPGSQSLGSMLSQWASAQRPFASQYQSIGEISLMPIMTHIFATLLAADAGGVARTQLIGTVVVGTSKRTTKLGFNNMTLSLQQNMASGAIIQSSQMVRINQSNTSGEAAVMEILADGANVMASFMGSQTSVILRLLLRAMSHLPLPGPEGTHVANLAYSLAVGLPAGVNCGALFFPLSPAAGAPAQINAVIISMSDFVRIRSGNYAVPVAYAAWAQPTWGVTTAVIPVSIDANNRGGMLVEHILARMEYPPNTTSFPAAMIQENNVAWVNNNVQNLVTKANLTRVPGPMTNVLIVACDQFDAIANNVQVTIGSIAPVVVTYAANSMNLAVPAPANLAPALTAEVANYAATLQNIAAATEYWVRKVGSTEDWFSAFMAAADHSAFIPPRPCKNENVMQGAYYSGNGNNGAVAYGAAQGVVPGYLPITNAILADIANACTTPLGVLCSSVLGDLQFARRPVTMIGVQDPVADVYTHWGTVSPVDKIKWDKWEVNLTTLVGRIRLASEHLAHVFDRTVASVGLPMEELLAPMTYQALAAVTTDVDLAWGDIYAQINDYFDSMSGGNIRYVPGAAFNYNSNFYAADITSPGTLEATLGWARVPYWMAAGVTKEPVPSTFRTKPFGKFSVSKNYPAQGDLYAVFHVPAPDDHEGSEADAYHRVAAMSVARQAVNPAGPIVPVSVPMLLATQVGSDIYTWGVQTLHPTAGVAMNIVLAGYNPVNGSSAIPIDVPIMPLPPVYLAREAQDMRMGCYGGFFGSVAVMELTQYAMRLPASDGTLLTQQASDQQPSLTRARAGKMRSFFQ
jgi:hypothetical protein